ncbi:mitochondrial 54S ribosomal protein img2 [Pleosporales sp. CAS-2024a]
MLLLPRAVTCRPRLRLRLPFSTAAPAAATDSHSPHSEPSLRNPPKPSELAAIVPFDQPRPKYFVARSTTGNLPVYTEFKRGGSLQLTTIRKVNGDLVQLRDELRAFLRKRIDHVTINYLTQHVVVKGHHKHEVKDFLEQRGF